MGELGTERRDLQGNFTYYGYNDSSTIDHILASEYTLTNTTIMQYMSVGDLSYLSDHEPLMLRIVSMLLSKSTETYQNICKLFFGQEKFIQNKNLTSIFINEPNKQSSEAFNSKSSKRKQRAYFIDKQKSFAYQKKTSKANSVTYNNNNILGKNEVSYNYETRQARQKLIYMTKALNKCKSQSFLQGQFFELKKFTNL